ncbi:MAG: FG-GAP repeat protein, partial [Deltaproteobacteria bacterium]|nr:FG-GAP repeat protein [Deltaproteobacteria bacterium]
MNVSNRFFVMTLAGILCLGAAYALPPATVHATPSFDDRSAWLKSVQKDIRQSRYHVHPLKSPSSQSYRAANPAHRLNACFMPEGVRVSPLSFKGSRQWEWGLSLESYGFEGALRPVDPQFPVPSGNRVEYRRGQLIEWYVNDDRGLEQGFTIDEPPSPAGKDEGRRIIIRMRVRGNLDALAERHTVRFVNGSGIGVLSLSKLYAVDACERKLDAEFRLQGNDLDIVVDAALACYPITVDPILARPGWAVYSRHGFPVGSETASAGDVNGDGYEDIIIGSWNCRNGEFGEGCVKVFHGSAGGLGLTPDWEAEGNREDARFGTAVASAGDVNGDGYDDVIIGATHYEYDEAEFQYKGAIFVYHGAASGLSTVADRMVVGDSGWFGFGSNVASAGDINGDGYDDVIVGARNYSNGEYSEGAAFVFMGSASGVSATPSWSFESNHGHWYMDRVNGAGDVNGDGYDDVIVGAHNYSNGESGEGAAFCFYGAASGLSATPAWTIESNRAGDHLGGAVAGAGDMNGDGYDDVLVGAYGYEDGETNEGAVYLYYGSPAGLGTIPGWMAEGNQEDSGFGIQLSAAGDLNGDGHPDVAIGAEGYGRGEAYEGAVFVYYGASTGPELDPSWIVDCNNEWCGLGRVAAGAGDVNSDGYDDLLVGAPGYMEGSWGGDGGAVLLYYGAMTGLRPGADWMGSEEVEESHYGLSVASAGDVNGDGYGDVIVGVPGFFDYGEDEIVGAGLLYLGSPSGLSASFDRYFSGNASNDWQGWSVAGAGDINGDGYDDIIIGTPFDSSPALAFHGRAGVYYGAADTSEMSGVVPDWTFEGTLSLGMMGYSVAGAGDVNGDGYDDVIVGEPGNDSGGTDAGRAYIFYGSASGLGDTPDWIKEPSQAGAWWGVSVAGAGDVNGDAYDDVIIGAFYFDNGETNEGNAFVYHGSVSGPSAGFDWRGQADQAYAYYGGSVAGAGDVNGDGYDDVIVGAAWFDTGESEEGRAFIYHGSATGLGAVPAGWAEGNLAAARFGSSVGGAGDFNGDGYADVVVGAPGYNDGRDNGGKAFMYFGGPWGLSRRPDWTAVGDQTDAQFSYSVAAAGDVNGDGFDDLIIGAPYFDLGAEDEGRASLYYGGPPNELLVDFGELGLWHYRKHMWTLLNAADAEDVMRYGRSVFVDFGLYGIYMYDGSEWRAVSAVDPDNSGRSMLIWKDMLVVDFGAFGLWVFDGAAWTMLTAIDPAFMGVFGDSFFVDLGSPWGLYAYDGAAWIYLTNASLDTAGNRTASAGSGLIGDFGIYGVWFYQEGVWTQLATVDAEFLLVANNVLFVDFGVYGLWAFFGGWGQLSESNPDNGGNTMVRWRNGVAVDFGGLGL